jgi:hypothetical protein
MPATIDDPAILDEIGDALKGHGVGGVVFFKMKASAAGLARVQ